MPKRKRTGNSVLNDEIRALIRRCWERSLNRDETMRFLQRRGIKCNIEAVRRWCVSMHLPPPPRDCEKCGWRGPSPMFPRGGNVCCRCYQRAETPEHLEEVEALDHENLMMLHGFGYNSSTTEEEEKASRAIREAAERVKKASLQVPGLHSSWTMKPKTYSTHCRKCGCRLFAAKSREAGYCRIHAKKNEYEP